MQIYEKRNDKSYHATPRCGYCRQEGHNRSQCPVAPQDWEYWKNYQVPVRTHGWYLSRNNPKYWGEWFLNCRNTMNKIEQRKTREKKLVARSPSKCGYCRSEGHTRRQCTEMKEFAKQCYKANENWRRAAYKEIVEKHGICVGACIEVQQKSGWNQNTPNEVAVAIITQVNFTNLNVMAAKSSAYYGGHNDPYECRLKVKAMINGEEIFVGIHNTARTRSCDEWDYSFPRISQDILGHSSSQPYWRGWSMSKLLSPSEHPLDESWVTDYKEAFDLMLKKRTKEQLDNDDVTSLINKWAKKV